MKTALILTLLSLSLTAQARVEGHDIGIGGDVVSCFSPEDPALRLKTEALDVSEARDARGIRLELGGAELSLERKVSLAISRLRPLNPSRAARYERFFAAFRQEAAFVRGKVLSDIPDSDELFLERNCRKEQIIIQKDPKFDQDPRYVIDADLWAAISDDDRAALILHELIWREMRVAGAVNSVPVRYFNSLIFGDRLKSLSSRDYIELVRKIGLPDYDAHGLNLSFCRGQNADPCARRVTPEFAANGEVSEAFVTPAAPAWDKDQPLQSVPWNGQDIAVAGEIRFHPDSEGRAVLKKITTARQHRFTVGDLTVHHVLGQAVRFHANGRLQSLNANQVTAASPRWETSCRGMLTFHENGATKRCLLAKAARFVGPDHDVVAQGPVGLDPQGRLNFASRIVSGHVTFQGEKRRVSLYHLSENGAVRVILRDEKVTLTLWGESFETRDADIQLEAAGQIRHVRSRSPFALKWRKLSSQPLSVTAVAFSTEKPGMVSLRLAAPARLPSSLGLDMNYQKDAEVLIDDGGRVTECRHATMGRNWQNVCPAD
ncbi:MAG: hypothetical protein KF865_01120 [Bdellovibrionaceae bacterium]|nr:hypothetical protein [Pseudobdellovibrionaceae bacterium]